MKKPTSQEALLKTIFLGIGPMFVAMGLLVYAGVMKPTASSKVQDPAVMGAVFVGIGGVFTVAALILGIIAARKSRLRNDLLISGIRINGVVDKVYRQTSTQYGSQSPYRICYTYTYQDKTYHHKSHYLWERPNLSPGDPITVYTNEHGKSMIFL